MMKRRGSRSFSAALTPAGVYVVGYRETGSELEVMEYSRRLSPGPDIAAAARALGDLIEAQGGRGGRVALAVAGFGAYHQILTLPAASRDVLLPVIERELRRVFPDLVKPDAEPPIVEYVEVDSTGIGHEGAQREMLAAAVPRSLITTVRESLASRGIELTHWTILPRAVQRLHDTFAAGDEPSAAIVVAEGMALIGFFQGGELRLFSDTPSVAADAGGATRLIDRVERGGLYLRQQFEGAGLERVLLAVEEGAEADAVASGVRERLGIAPEPFGPYSAMPGAMLALGGALDAAAEDPFDLLPADLRPPTRHERWSSILAIASALLVVAAAGWWGWTGVRAEQTARERMHEVRAALDSRAPEFAAAREVVEARRSHAQRTELLRTLLAGRERLPEMLWPLETAPGPIRIRSLQILPSDGGWTARVQGTANASSTAQAAAAIDALFRSIQSELPDATVSVDEMSPPQPAREELSEDSEFVVPIAITFRMSFIVPAVEEAVR